MKFSIITVCFNSAGTIAETFESVLAQDYTDYEYLAVDGGSTDGTVDLIQAYEPKFGGRLHWTSEPDKGIYDAMNKGFARARGEYAVFINSSDLLEPGALAAVAETEKQNPGGTVYYGITRVLGPDGVEVEVIRRHHSLLCNGCLQHQSCYFSLTAYRQFGGYDFSQFKLAADYDYTLRLWKNGGRFFPVDRILASFRLDGTTGTDPIRARKEVLAVRKKYGFISSLHVFLDLESFRIREWASRNLKKIFLFRGKHS